MMHLAIKSLLRLPLCLPQTNFFDQQVQAMQQQNVRNNRCIDYMSERLSHRTANKLAEC